MTRLEAIEFARTRYNELTSYANEHARAAEDKYFSETSQAIFREKSNCYKISALVIKEIIDALEADL